MNFHRTRNNFTFGFQIFCQIKREKICKIYYMKMSVFYYFEREITNPIENLKVAKMPQTKALQ